MPHTSSKLIAEPYILTGICHRGRGGIITHLLKHYLAANMLQAVKTLFLIIYKFFNTSIFFLDI